VKCRYIIGSGTSATLKITKNGVDQVTSISATTTAGSTDFTDFDVASGDYIEVEITAVSGDPEDLSFSLIKEITI